jgi:hypothetical protein
MRRNHAGVTGVPCSVVNTYGLAPPWRGRKARNSGPRRGWTDSIPPFSRFTCNRPCFRSTSDQRSRQSSEALSPCRYPRRIAATSLAPFLPRLRAVSRSLVTSPSVRYSRGRYSALVLRRRDSVRFTVVGAVSDIPGLP